MPDTLTVYGLPGCDACRRARAWLDTHGVAARFVDVRAQAPGAHVLAQACAALGWETVLNRRSTTWRALPESERSVTDAAGACALIALHPALLKRPLLLGPGVALAGFDAPAWAAALGLAA